MTLSLEPGSGQVQHSASFRDPSGYIFRRRGQLFRQVNAIYRRDYDLLMASGLYQRLVERGWLIPHQEVQEDPLEPSSCYRVIQPEEIPFIYYPYEWCFSQIKDAALLTLSIQREALQAGMMLKDASAYNIQFHKGKPILIDTLSFTAYEEGMPWVAYRQFCQHFLAPLALMSRVDLRLGRLLMVHMDGLPLDLASRLLPGSTRFNFGLLTHVHLHARAQQVAFTTTPAPNNPRYPGKRLSKAGLIGLIESLEATVRGLNAPIRKTGWVEYYQHTNYTNTTFESKKRYVQETVQRLAPRLVWDLGANTGVFSRVAAGSSNALVISADYDPEAVEVNYQQVKREHDSSLLPLVIDLTNPSPAIGWDNTERDSFYQRGPADLVLALALVHHLAIGNNVPLERLAATFARLGKYLLVEFVPKEDSQVQKLLQSREDIFPDYHLEGFKRAFARHFQLEKEMPIEGSARTLLLYRKV